MNHGEKSFKMYFDVIMNNLRTNKLLMNEQNWSLHWLMKNYVTNSDFKNIIKRKSSNQCQING